LESILSVFGSVDKRPKAVADENQRRLPCLISPTAQAPPTFGSETVPPYLELATNALLRDAGAAGAYWPCGTELGHFKVRTEGLLVVCHHIEYSMHGIVDALADLPFQEHGRGEYPLDTR
jgi:hypothetical protein